MLNLHARGVVHSIIDFKNQNTSNKSKKYGVAKEYMEGKKISGKFSSWGRNNWDWPTFGGRGLHHQHPPFLLRSYLGRLFCPFLIRQRKEQRWPRTCRQQSLKRSLPLRASSLMSSRSHCPELCTQQHTFTWTLWTTVLQFSWLHLHLVTRVALSSRWGALSTRCLMWVSWTSLFLLETCIKEDFSCNTPMRWGIYLFKLVGLFLFVRETAI